MLTNPYNPDVLSCLANLSSDEVFTPPNLANQMLDELPVDLWKDPNARFLDPFCKSGVFLREIAKRLIEGLENEFPDIQERINHIFKNQIYGIAITELTALLSRRSLYCSKKANSEFAVSDVFDDEHGNIRISKTDHTWKNGKCIFCGASKSQFGRDSSYESHAYEFIHTNSPEKIFNMKFDVIIGNPPYQLDTGGSGRQAKPIYHKFVNQAIKMKPRFIVMITPSRWFSGGMGLQDFREEMLSCAKIEKIVDFENASLVFPGVDIAGGVSYFLWSKDYFGDCEVTTNRDKSSISVKRPLDEYKIFVRDSSAIDIIRKVSKSNSENKTLSEVVSGIRPFGLPTNYKPKHNGVPCWFIQRLGKRFATENDLHDKNDYLNKWKLLIPKAPIAGQTDFSKPVRFYHSKNAFIARPGEACTESWIVAFSSRYEDDVINFRKYLFTKVVRFLILQTVISQDVNRMNFIFFLIYKIIRRNLMIHPYARNGI